MSRDISGVRFERLRWIGRLVYRRQGLLLEWGSFRVTFCSLSGFGGRNRAGVFVLAFAPGERH